MAGLLILAMLTSILVTGVTVNAAEDLPFTDVPDTWYTEAVATVYSEGIMKGKTETTFDPMAKITRAEVVTAFARVACTNIDTYGKDLPFTDTFEGQWYSDSVGWAAACGIVAGRGGGIFSPADNITRAELASILTKFIAYMGVELPDNSKIDKFADADTFDGWMVSPIEEVRKNGLMQGSDGKFNPRGNATRAEIATVIMNLLPDAGRVAVVEDGKSDYVIVAGEAYIDAAERLQYQIEYTTGAKLDIVDSTKSSSAIFLGDTSINTDGLGEDGFEIKLDGSKVYVDGETVHGVYRGAVRFAKAAISGDDARFTVKTAERDEFTYPVEKLTINGNDISKYQILYPANASEKTMIGAGDLAEYIEKACGVKLTAKAGTTGDYAIIIEEKTVKADGAADDRDSFKVKSEGNNIRLTGDAARGAMYACYDLLEKIGCRFLTPSVEYIIESEEVNLAGLDYTESSPFANRRIYADTFNSSGDMKNKLRDAEGLPYTGGNCHTFDGLDGAASNQYENQPCLSSEEVYQTMLAGVRALLAANPDAKLISVSQNDNIRYCECDNCMADYAKYTKEEGEPQQGGTAGQMIAFVNRMISDIEKDYPDVLVHTFAYQYTQHAPANIVPDEKVVVQLCSIECCFAHPLAGAEAVCAASNAPFSQDIKDWAKLATTLFVWDYNNNFSYRGTPFPNLTYDILAGNMKLFAENNVRGLFLQGNASMGNNGEFDYLRWYLEAKLAWDPYMSEDEYYTHMREFMEGFYGDGWQKVYDSLMLLHKKYNGKHIGVFDNTKTLWMPTVLKPCIDELIGNMEAAKLTSESKAQFEAVDCSQIQFDYVYLDTYFDTWYKSSDPELNKKAQDMSFALQNKFQKYDVRLSDAFDSPNLPEFTVSPSGWKDAMDEILNAD